MPISDKRNCDHPRTALKFEKRSAKMQVGGNGGVFSRIIQG